MSSHHLDLVYDVGAHNGDDTAYYLSLGYRVIAVEADPDLVAALERRFAEEIRNGRCVVRGVGIAAHDGDAPFYLSSDSVLNSFDRDWASQDGRHVREVRIQCRRFESLLDTHGVPFYLKVDIEGNDHLCVLALTQTDRPPYLSFEGRGDVIELARHLDRIGYSRFRLVDQNAGPVAFPKVGTAAHVAWSARQFARLELRRHPRIHGALKRIRARPAASLGLSTATVTVGDSGPMPHEIDAEWSSFPEFLHTFIRARDAGILDSSWFDVHAAT